MDLESKKLNGGDAFGFSVGCHVVQTTMRVLLADVNSVDVSQAKLLSRLATYL